MSYLTDNMVKVADRYGISGSVQEGDDIVTFTSDDKSLQIVGRHEIEVTLSMTVNGQPFNLEDGASNFAEHSIEMAVSRLLKARKVMEACVSALNESGWSVEVIKTDYTRDYVRMTKGSKKAYMYLHLATASLFVAPTGGLLPRTCTTLVSLTVTSRFLDTVGSTLSQSDWPHITRGLQ